MNKKYKVRATSVNVVGQKYIGFDIPKEMIDNLNLADGEILDCEIVENGFNFIRTGIINNE